MLAVGEGERKRAEFIMDAISDHKTSEIYNADVTNTLYYNGENPTINQYEKIIYDEMGKAHVDMWTANHKIASLFFGFAVDQETGYLLGNGVTFKDAATKEKLGTSRFPFDQQAYVICKSGAIAGASYGFWNLDHVERITAREFVPLIDEDNGAMMAGIRFWQLDGSKPLRVTLFELDGYTEYIKLKGEEMTVRTPKRGYVARANGSAIARARGEGIYQFENYNGFPIVPFYYTNDLKSAMSGKRNTIDALDLVTSGMVNNVDEGALIYWVLKGAGGMDDMDLVQFRDRIKTVKAASLGDGQDATPHSIEAPFTGTQSTIDMLQRKLYQDFQCFDSSAISAGNQTATAIKASYVPLDLKCDKLEVQVTKFINGILTLAGIDDVPSYTRNKLVNSQEEMQTLMLAAPYLSEDYMTRKALTIMGDTDMADEIMRQRSAEDAGRFGDTEE